MEDLDYTIPFIILSFLNNFFSSKYSINGKFVFSDTNSCIPSSFLSIIDVIRSALSFQLIKNKIFLKKISNMKSYNSQYLSSSLSSFPSHNSTKYPMPIPILPAPSPESLNNIRPDSIHIPYSPPSHQNCALSIEFNSNPIKSPNTFSTSLSSCTYTPSPSSSSPTNPSKRHCSNSSSVFTFRSHTPRSSLSNQKIKTPLYSPSSSPINYLKSYPWSDIDNFVNPGHITSNYVLPSWTDSPDIETPRWNTIKSKKNHNNSKNSIYKEENEIFEDDKDIVFLSRHRAAELAESAFYEEFYQARVLNIKNKKARFNNENEIDDFSYSPSQSPLIFNGPLLSKTSNFSSFNPVSNFELEIPEEPVFNYQICLIPGKYKRPSHLIQLLNEKKAIKFHKKTENNSHKAHLLILRLLHLHLYLNHLHKGQTNPSHPEQSLSLKSPLIGARLTHTPFNSSQNHKRLRSSTSLPTPPPLILDSPSDIPDITVNSTPSSDHKIIFHIRPN